MALKRFPDGIDGLRGLRMENEHAEGEEGALVIRDSG